MDLSFFSGKRVFITGHTGFKGSWLCKVLINAGARVTGYALAPQEGENLYDLCALDGHIESFIDDIRDAGALERAFSISKPDIVIHMAAQPLVRESYKNPRYTYETNVMGTVNILECIKNSGDHVKSLLNVTTDKVYQNNEWEWGYRETERLDGYDPYSNSKSCSELVTGCYVRSFLNDKGVSVSTVRAGNVIGGGDFSADRILPDCFSAARNNRPIEVRNPYSIRPYQHVLEPLFGYLLVSKMQCEDPALAGQYNIGPEDKDCATTGRLVDLFCENWGNGQRWIDQHDGGPHEANFLKLDCSRIKKTFDWQPAWNLETAVNKTVDWYRNYSLKNDVASLMDRQISEYLEDFSS